MEEGSSTATNNSHNHPFYGLIECKLQSISPVQEMEEGSSTATNNSHNHPFYGPIERKLQSISPVQEMEEGSSTATNNSHNHPFYGPIERKLQSISPVQEMAADWSELPSDMLFSIAMQTKHLSDYIRMGSVCKSWESAITENPRPPHLGFPLLLISRETMSNSRRDHFLCSPFERKLHPIRLPDRSRPVRCLGSSLDGWICMVDNCLNLNLLSPFSGALVTLPALRTNSINEPTLNLLHGRGSLEFRLHENGFAVVRSGEYMRDEYLTKAVWSVKPTDDNCVIVILLQEALRIVYCRLDETCWIEIQTPFDFLSDAIFHKEKLYVVCDQAPRVATIDLLGQDQETLLPELEDFHLVWGKTYLAACPSGLLFISRHLLPYEAGFQIFKLDETSTKWAETNSLDDGMLFLGVNTSMWLPSRNFNECNGNSIYFTGADMFLGDDSGVFNLEDRSYGSVYDQVMKPLYPQPVWVVPYPLKKKKVGFLA